MISEDTKIKGTLNAKNDIRIAGKLEGEAKANGKLILASTGRIDGDIEAVDADIAGNLKGEIHVSNKLIVRQSAVVDGDIYAKSLLVEEGAQINGACRMNETQAAGSDSKFKSKSKFSGTLSDSLKSKSKEEEA